MLKFSIIVPMYNVEKYIEKCLLSCLHQDIPYSEYEIIIVNDGSPDGSLAIAQNIALQYSNIRIISQENKGLSEARNVGLSNAKGEYIWFVDSDDVIREKCLAQIIRQCDSQRLELLAFCAADVINDAVIRRFSYTCKDVLKGGDVLNKGLMICCAPFTIYRKDFLLKNKLYFYPSIYYEDTEFSPRSYFFAERVGFTNDILYFYTANPESITKTLNPKRAFDRITIALSLDSFYTEHVSLESSIFFHNYISQVFNNGLNLFLDNSFENVTNKKIKNNFEIEMYKVRHLFKHFRQSSFFKYKLEGYLFAIFPKHYILVYKIIKYIHSVIR